MTIASPRRPVRARQWPLIGSLAAIKRIALASMPSAVLAMTAGPAVADEFYDRYFAKPGQVCYARFYDAAHLARHLRQQVQRIEIVFGVGSAAGKPPAPGAFELQLGIVAKNGKSFRSTAYCATGGDHFACKLESDGGSFRLAAARDNALVLRVTGDGLRFEGATFIEIGGRKSDDNVFELSRADWRRCRVAAGR